MMFFIFNQMLSIGSFGRHELQVLQNGEKLPTLHYSYCIGPNEDESH